MKKLLLAAVGAAVLAGAAAFAQSSISLLQVIGINSDDQFQDIVHGYPTAQSKFANALLLGNYSQTTPGGNPENALIGGDASTNLWQRGTAGTSQTQLLPRAQASAKSARSVFTISPWKRYPASNQGWPELCTFSGFAPMTMA